MRLQTVWLFTLLNATLLPAIPPNNFTNGAIWDTAALAEQRGQNNNFARFNNEWWMVGGTRGNGSGAKIFNEIWHSADGIFWEKVPIPFPAASSQAWQLYAFGNRLFALGNGNAINGGAAQNIWVSTDGKNWSKPNLAPPHVFGGAVLNGRFWVFTVSNNLPQPGYSIIYMYSTGDGVNWTPRSTTLHASNFTPLSLKGYLGKLWLDGYLFTGVTTYATFSLNNGSTWAAETFPDVFTSATLITEHRLWAIKKSTGELLTSNNLSTFTLLTSGSLFKTTPYQPPALPSDILTMTTTSTGLWMTRTWPNFQYAGLQVPHEIYSSTTGINWNLRALWNGHAASATQPVVAWQNKAWNYDSAGLVYRTDANASWDLKTSQAVVRQSPAMAVFQDQLWLAGGANDAGTHSSTDSITWIRRATTTNMGERVGLTLGVYANQMWGIGGSTQAGAAGKFDDVYKTSDGINWTTVTTQAPWPGRSNANAVAFKNKLWLQGGMAAPPKLSYLRDLWSTTDGVSWTSHTVPAQLTTATLTRLAIVNDELILAGSENLQAFNKTVANPHGWVWSSSDGDHWTLLATDPGFEGNILHGFAQFGQRLVLFNGPLMTPWYSEWLKNEVWDWAQFE